MGSSALGVSTKAPKSLAQNSKLDRDIERLLCKKFAMRQPLRNQVFKQAGSSNEINMLNVNEYQV